MSQNNRLKPRVPVLDPEGLGENWPVGEFCSQGSKADAYYSLQIWLFEDIVRGKENQPSHVCLLGTVGRNSR